MQLLLTAVACGLALSALCLASRAEPAQDPAKVEPGPCVLETGSPATVASIRDGETLILDDGREVRLIGALVSRTGSGDRKDDAAMRRLKSLVSGKPVKLGLAGRRTDRYGRLLAHVFVQENGEDHWVQGTLLADGLGYAYGLPESFACIDELLAHETVARQSRLGLWSDPNSGPRPAWRTGDLMRARNAFQIVEGRVRDVAMTKNSVFLNFGDDWRQDFTAGIALSEAKVTPGWLDDLMSLKGRRVEVRGWIERRNGPFIEVMHKAQITKLDEPSRSGPKGRPALSPRGTETRSTPPLPPAQTQPSPVPNENRPDQTGPGAVDL